MMSESNDCIKTENCLSRESRIRRPPNAFMIFGQQFRKVLANKFEDLSNKEISKLLGDEWKKLGDDIKKEYHQMAEEANRQHLQKYPGYYYSPLEARKRKAERKHKLIMSRISKNKEDRHKTNGSVVGPFFWNNRNPLYPMMRPVFGPPFPPRISYGPQFIRFRPNFGGSFGGYVPTTPFPMPQTYPIPQYYPIEQMIVKNEVKDENNSCNQFEDKTKSPDIGLLTSLLPPMINHNIEVTPVLHNLCDNTSLCHNINDNNVTKMTNAVVEPEFISSQVLNEKESKGNDFTHIQSKVTKPEDD